MITRSTVLVATLALAGVCPAQSKAQWTAPAFSHDGADAFWDFTKNPALQGLTGHPRPLWAISGHKMPSDAAGTWTLCFTIRALVRPWNQGFSGFLIAKWTPGAATPLTLTSQANGLNEAFIDYNLNLEPVTRNARGKVSGGGRYGVFDRFQFASGGGLEHLGVFLASRADDQAGFGKAQKVAGILGTTVHEFADPTLGYVDGGLMLFYAAIQKDPRGRDVQGVWMQRLHVGGSSGPAVTGKPVLVARATDRGQSNPPWIVHSPALVHGADGDVEGMFVAEGDDVATFARSDFFYAADLAPQTPHVPTLNSTGWLSGGALAGGTFLFNDSVMDGVGARHVEGAWLVGDRVARGGIADVTMSAYSPPGKQATALLFTGPWLRRPVQLPGVLGTLGILTFPLGVAKTNADQQATWRFRMPRWHATLPIQGISIQHTGSGVVRTLTNTATIRSR